MSGGLPRLLTIMGSGETAPTMVKVHRAVRDRLGPDASGVLLDTPYGFQRNADDLSARAVAYFRDSVGMTMTPADFRSSADLEGTEGHGDHGADGRRPVAVLGSREPQLRVAPVGRDPGPGTPRREARSRRCRHLRQRSGSHARGAHCSRLRDLQGRRRRRGGSRDSTFFRSSASRRSSSRITTTPKAAPTTRGTATWGRSASTFLRT